MVKLDLVPSLPEQRYPAAPVPRRSFQGRSVPEPIGDFTGDDDDQPGGGGAARFLQENHAEHAGHGGADKKAQEIGRSESGRRHRGGERGRERGIRGPALSVPVLTTAR